MSSLNYDAVGNFRFNFDGHSQDSSHMVGENFVNNHSSDEKSSGDAQFKASIKVQNGASGDVQNFDLENVMINDYVKQDSQGSKYISLKDVFDNSP